MAKSQVWCSFQVTRKDGTVVKLRIQDAPQDRAADLIDFMMEHFTSKENLLQASGIPRSETAMKRSRQLLENGGVLEGCVLICCHDDDDGPSAIVGASFMQIRKQDGSTKLMNDHGVEGEPTKEELKLYSIFEYLDINSYLFRHFNVDSYYEDFGVAVLREYSGCGIATRIFDVRVQVCEAENIPLTGAWMTATGSQRAAEKAGYHTVRDIPWDQFIRDTDVGVIEDPPESLKFMARAVGSAGRRI